MNIKIQSLNWDLLRIKRKRNKGENVMDINEVINRCKEMSISVEQAPDIQRNYITLGCWLSELKDLRKRFGVNTNADSPINP